MYNLGIRHNLACMLAYETPAHDLRLCHYFDPRSGSYLGGQVTVHAWSKIVSGQLPFIAVYMPDKVERIMV